MTTDTPGVVIAVVVFSLAAAAVCLILAAYFAFADHRATAALRDAAKEAGAKAGERLANPATPQTGPIDFKGLAELATALEKLNRSSSFLIGALAFAAAASVAAGAGSIASAV